MVGEAAKAFTQKVTDLPDYLQRAHDSLEAAGGEIARWSDTLHDLKVRAGHYEADAEEARGRPTRRSGTTRPPGPTRICGWQAGCSPTRRNWTTPRPG